MRQLSKLVQVHQMLKLSITPGFRRYSSGGGYLRESYHCNDSWSRRLQTPVLQNVNTDDLFFELDQKYQTDKVISAIDVDIYLNKIADPEALDEIEELAFRLRKSPATTDALPSTSHALIRAFLNGKRTDDLMRILNDRMNYGIFVDFHIANVLMDEFIKNGNHRDAAKVASLLMLEEDFGTATSKLFSLISCLKYIQDPKPEPWDPAIVEAAEGSEEPEEKKIRMRRIREVYFDFHFDLSEPHHLVGKTLAMVGKVINEDPALSASAQLIGWATYGKWEAVENILQNCINSKKEVYEESVKIVKELLEKAVKDLEASPTKNLPQPKLKQFPGMNLTEKEVADFWKKVGYPDYAKILPSVKTALESPSLSIKKQGEDNLVAKAEKLLSSALAEREDVEIAEQEKIYEHWNDLRKDELDRQIRRFKAFQLTEEIAETKKELKEKEEVIFFFDNEEEWMMKLPQEEQAGYKLSTDYRDRASFPFVKVIPPKKLKKKKSKV